MANADLTLSDNQPQNEVWKSVPGYEGFYSVSNLGRVRRDAPYTNTYAGRILNPRSTQFGHLRIGLCKHNKTCHFYVHYLVAQAFIGERPAGLVVNHLNHDPADNRPENLEYVSQRDNLRHAAASGRMATGDRNARRKYPEINLRGEDNHASVLKVSQVKEIRSLFAQGHKIRPLARRFQVNRNTIKNIVLGVIWKHVV